MLVGIMGTRPDLAQHHQPAFGHPATVSIGMRFLR
jgi:hypothetical protein